MPQPYLAHKRLNQMPSKVFITLGILLLVGFAMPIVTVPCTPRASAGYPFLPYSLGPSTGDTSFKTEFLNFTGLTETGVPDVLKVMLLYPFLAGIAMIVLGTAVRGMGRSIPVMVLGVLPILILLTAEDVRRGLEKLPSELVGTGAASILAIVGWTGVFAGGLALRYQKTNRAAAITASVGGGLYLLYLLMPVTSGFSRDTTIPLLQPFQLFSQTHDREIPVSLALLGLCLIAQMGIMIAASMMALRYTFARNLRDKFTGSVFTLVWWIMVVGGVMVLIVISKALAEVPSAILGEVVMPVFIILVKMGCWVGGLVFLLPIGLADLLLALNPNGEDSRGFLPNAAAAPSIAETPPEVPCGQVPCPACGHLVSVRARACPQCGDPFSG
jgi:hypothetical protein